MTTHRGPHNQTNVPVLDRYGQPLAPARPSRVRRWLESGRAHKVWIKGIFAVQLHDLDAATGTAGNFAFNMDPGEATGIAITRESPDGKRHTIVGAYEHQHRNRDIHRGDFATPIPQRMCRTLTNLLTNFVISLDARNLRVLPDFRASPALEGLPKTSAAGPSKSPRIKP